MFTCADIDDTVVIACCFAHVQRCKQRTYAQVQMQLLTLTHTHVTVTHAGI